MSSSSRSFDCFLAAFKGLALPPGGVSWDGGVLDETTEAYLHGLRHPW